METELVASVYSFKTKDANTNASTNKSHSIPPPIAEWTNVTLNTEGKLRLSLLGNNEMLFFRVNSFSRAVMPRSPIWRVSDHELIIPASLGSYWLFKLSGPRNDILELDSVLRKACKYTVTDDAENKLSNTYLETKSMQTPPPAEIEEPYEPKRSCKYPQYPVNKPAEPIESTKPQILEKISLTDTFESSHPTRINDTVHEEQAASTHENELSKESFPELTEGINCKNASNDDFRCQLIVSDTGMTKELNDVFYSDDANATQEESEEFYNCTSSENENDNLCTEQNSSLDLTDSTDPTSVERTFNQLSLHSDSEPESVFTPDSVQVFSPSLTSPETDKHGFENGNFCIVELKNHGKIRKPVNLSETDPVLRNRTNSDLPCLEDDLNCPARRREQFVFSPSPPPTNKLGSGHTASTPEPVLPLFNTPARIVPQSCPNSALSSRRLQSSRLYGQDSPQKAACGLQVRDRWAYSLNQRRHCSLGAIPIDTPSADPYAIQYLNVGTEPTQSSNEHRLRRRNSVQVGLLLGDNKSQFGCIKYWEPGLMHRVSTINNSHFYRERPKTI